jgi:hypothetical protein
MALDQIKAQDVWNKLYNANPDVTNRFNNYQNPFSYSDMSGNLNDIFNSQTNNLNQQTSSDIAQQQGNAAGSLASQGITGGSLLTDTQTGIASKLNKNKYNALAAIGQNRAQGTMNLQNLFNQNQLQTTQLAQGVDEQNFGNQMQQANSLSGFLNQREQLGMEQQQMPNTLSDIFSGLKLGGQIASIPMSGGGSLLSGLFKQGV